MSLQDSGEKKKEKKRERDGQRDKQSDGNRQTFGRADTGRWTDRQTETDKQYEGETY